ncbi:hypothetical protein ACWD7F_07690 [Streptomyces sp. NPDC005122]
MRRRTLRRPAPRPASPVSATAVPVTPVRRGPVDPGPAGAAAHQKKDGGPTPRALRAVVFRLPA